MIDLQDYPLFFKLGSMSKVLYKTDNLNIIGQINVSGLTSEAQVNKTTRYYNLKLTLNIFINGKLKVFDLNFSLEEGNRGEIKTLQLKDYSNFRIFEEILNNLGYELKDGNFAINANKWTEELINGYDGEKFLI